MKGYNGIFFERMLCRLGFHPKWIRNVIFIVRSVMYEVKYNDQVTDLLLPGRGLRQGDPLSPYLFIICTEWLSWRITQNETQGHFGRIKICRGAPSITYLFFANDSLLFFKTNQRSIQTIKHVLSDYEIISGQQINYNKS